MRLRFSALLFASFFIMEHAAAFGLICGDEMFDIDERNRSVRTPYNIYEGNEGGDNLRPIVKFDESIIVFEHDSGANNKGRRFQHLMYSINRYTGILTKTHWFMNGKEMNPSYVETVMCEKRGDARF